MEPEIKTPETPAKETSKDKAEAPKTAKTTAKTTARTAPKAKTVGKTHAPAETSYEKSLDAIRSGSKMKLKGEKGYFIHNDGRLEHRADNGDFLDSAPLSNYSEKTGWSKA